MTVESHLSNMHLIVRWWTWSSVTTCKHLSAPRLHKGLLTFKVGRAALACINRYLIKPWNENCPNFTCRVYCLHSNPFITAREPLRHKSQQNWILHAKCYRRNCSYNCLSFGDLNSPTKFTLSISQNPSSTLGSSYLFLFQRNNHYLIMPTPSRITK